jgi:hypothetical protein
MTPFESWYSSTVEPQLNETLKAAPLAARPLIAKASKETMANCWNAALRTICQTKFTREEWLPSPCQLPGEIREQIHELEAKP